MSALALGLGLLLIPSAYAIPLLPSLNELEARQNANQSLLAYSLPNNNGDSIRALGITTKQATFLYGPGIGGGPSSPAGPLGTTYITADSLVSDSELAAHNVISANDTLSATVNSGKYNNLQTVDDYTLLYSNEWQPSSAPTGIDPGMLTNFTQDLLFSMERLSFNPYAVRRLSPSESLPFTADPAIIRSITGGQDLSALQQSNRLFYIDHRAQGSLPRTNDGKYAPACDALFYISRASGDFLPLAIRTNTGNRLVYTPKDTADDWLLAKMMFNTNDFFMGQLHHLANTHYVTETAYQAAVRTLSDDHPVLAILKRLMYGAFGIRPLALAVLFPPIVGAFDMNFGYTGSAAAQFAADIYSNGYAGAFQGNYFRRNLEKRGLLNRNPPLKNFPFYEDAAPIYDAQRVFMTSFVNSYYTTPASLTADNELQAWLKEANGPAKAIDFPQSISTTSELVDLLTHMAHLVSTAHHSVNLNQLVTGSATLPFHPTAQYLPIPTAKGVTNVVDYLPPLEKCISIIQVSANFARPLLAASNRTLAHMFDDEIMLARMNQATRDANAKFIAAMEARSEVVRNRGFGSAGLSQGMPIVWKALDPMVAPWSMTI